MKCTHLDQVVTDRPNTHFHATTHAMMSSLEHGDSRSWCHVDEVQMELD